MTINQQLKHLYCNPNTLGRQLGDEFVLVNMDTDVVYTMSKTASLLWISLQTGSSIDEIRAKILEKYDITAEAMEHELKEAISQLTDLGLLRSQPFPDQPHQSNRDWV